MLPSPPLPSHSYISNVNSIHTLRTLLKGDDKLKCFSKSSVIQNTLQKLVLGLFWLTSIWTLSWFSALRGSAADSASPSDTGGQQFGDGGGKFSISAKVSAQVTHLQSISREVFFFRKRRKCHERRLTFGKLVSNKVSMAVTKQQVTGERNCGWRSWDVHLKAENMVVNCHYFFKSLCTEEDLISISHVN